MIKVNTLSARIAVATLSILAIGVVVLGLVFYFSFDHMEQKLLEMMDSYASQDLSGHQAQITDLTSSSEFSKGQAFIRFSSADNVPEQFRNLKIGFHHDVEFNDRKFHVAIKEYEGIKKYLVFDITELETQEHILYKIIFLSTTAAFIISIWIAYWLTRKVIRPVRDFAEQVENIDPNTRNLRIAEQYSDVEIGMIARSFDRYMERLDGFVEREQSFTSTASHELRTPLSVISTSVELLENNKDLPSNSRQYISRIKRSADEMSNLISALLFLAREDQPNNYAPAAHTNVTQLVSDVVNTYKYVEKDKDIKLNISANQSIEVDAPKSHVQIIINNLLNNAIRYTPKGSIQINCNKNKLEVIDSGLGIDDETLQRAFERGFRGEDSIGYGFGLYICKRICDRYGWSISLSRNETVGTTACISF